jgi:hypothetical protein
VHKCLDNLLKLDNKTPSEDQKRSGSYYIVAADVGKWLPPDTTVKSDSISSVK